LNFQDLISKLNQYWARQGCAMLPPGAAAWPELDGPLCLAGAARRCGPPSDGLEGFYRYRVLLRPAPAAARKLFLESFRPAGIDRSEHDLRWLPFDGEAGRCGWLVLLDGLALGKFVYLRKAGAEAAELELGLERFALAAQRKKRVSDLCWAGRLTYGELHRGEQCL
jgi:glycyl-tRNA synthetase alpha chain